MAARSHARPRAAARRPGRAAWRARRSSGLLMRKRSATLDEHPLQRFDAAAFFPLLELDVERGHHCACDNVAESAETPADRQTECAHRNVIAGTVMASLY